MSQVISFKCPSCGGYLVFDPVKQRFQCPYCGGSFAENELKEQSEQRQQAAEQARSAEPNSELRSYHCQMCGAEIVTDATTAATRCYYCHSPVVLNDRLTDEFRPDGVIPFKLDKKAAIAQLTRYYKGKAFLPKAFKSQNHIAELQGVYVPFWLYDAEADARGSYEGLTTESHREGDYMVTTTQHYDVRREGSAAFAKVPVDGSSKMPNEPEEKLVSSHSRVKGLLSQPVSVIPIWTVLLWEM